MVTLIVTGCPVVNVIVPTFLEFSKRFVLSHA